MEDSHHKVEFLYIGGQSYFHGTSSNQKDGANREYFHMRMYWPRDT